MKFAPPQGPWKSILSDEKKIKLDQNDQKLKMTILLSLDFKRNTRFESGDLTNVTQIITYIYVYIHLYIYINIIKLPYMQFFLKIF